MSGGSFSCTQLWCCMMRVRLSREAAFLEMHVSALNRRSDIHHVKDGRLKWRGVNHKTSCFLCRATRRAFCLFNLCLLCKIQALRLFFEAGQEDVRVWTGTPEQENCPNSRTNTGNANKRAQAELLEETTDSPSTL